MPRQVHGERSSALGTRVDFDVALVGGHDSLGDVKTQSEIVIRTTAGASRRVPAFHRAENAVELFGRNCCAAVLNRDQCFLIVAAHRDSDFRPFAAVLDSIFNKIRQCLAYSCTIPFAPLSITSVDCDLTRWVRG